MHFAIDSGGIGSGGLVLLFVFVAIALSVVRYNSVTRPRQEREIAEARDAEAREHRAAHENDVPL